MIVLFWAAITLIAYTYFGYPAWIYLRSRLCARPWKRAEMYPRISIVMAVHNGAGRLREKIDHLLSLDYPPELVEVIVVSDGSYDGTNEILREITHPRLQAVICDKHRGKAAAVNEGIRKATGEVLVFVDIRPRLEADALRRLISNFADPAVGSVAGELCLRIDEHDPGTRAVGSLYWRYERWMRRCEARIDSAHGVSGAFYAVRRQLAVLMPEGLILDDMYEPLCIVRQGFRVVLDEEARVWDVLPKTTTGEFYRKVRTLAGNYQLLQLAPWLLGESNRLRWQFVSHKLLRLLVPFLLLIVMAASWSLRGDALYRGFFFLQLLFYVLALLGLAREVPLLSRGAGPASAFVVLNAAAAVALFKFLILRRSLWRVWVHPELSSELVGTPAVGTDEQVGPCDRGL